VRLIQLIGERLTGGVRRDTVLQQVVKSHSSKKEVGDMTEILGWGTAGGLGIFFAGFGVFLWGLQFARRGK